MILMGITYSLSSSKNALRQFGTLTAQDSRTFLRSKFQNDQKPNDTSTIFDY